MKRFTVILLVLFSVSASAVFASSSLSVPLSSDAYRIIDNAVLRGIIGSQPDVRPYSVSLVRSLLDSILESGRISSSEREVIEDLEGQLDHTYGMDRTESFSDFLDTGRYVLLDNDFASSCVGFKFSTSQRFETSGGAFDSRNKATAYIGGEILGRVSYYMDFSLMVDHLDHRAFNVVDFYNECEGWYSLLLGDTRRIEKSPFTGVASGLAMAPEIAASFLDNRLTLRFGSVKRDWGPGTGNLALSSSARTFDGLEFTYSPAPAFSFSWLAGSLGKGFLSLEGEAPPIGGTALHSDEYDNNFSIQRIEISPIKGLKLSIYESVVWRKRLELAYLSPLTVYMFAQNYIGDFDNMLAGFDVSYTFSGIGRVYFAMSIDEMYTPDPRKLLTCPRNEFGLQGGLDLYLPVFSFSRMTIQATYIPAFYGTHYLFTTNPYGSGSMAIDYANKGQSLAYPLYPDTLELLASFETTLAHGISLSLTVKDQMRSAQYATSGEYGTTSDAIMNYDAFYAGKYKDRDFFSYIWKNTVDVSLDASRRFPDLPVSVNAGVQLIADSKRPYSVSTVSKEQTNCTDLHDFNYNSSSGLYGDGTTMGSTWSTDVRLVLKLGMSIWY